MSSVSASLTEAQLSAVEHRDGPLLILAGPGSGKTRVITHRIAKLIESGISSREILALTFTNKAADEMKRRVAGLADEHGAWIGTFHRFCSMLLRKYADCVGLDSNFTIYDAGDSQRALKHALEGLDLDLTHTPLGSLTQAISATKNKLITPDKYVSRAGSAIGPIMAKAYPAYQKQLLQANAVDFDDLLVHVATMLRESEELREMLDRRYRFIMVDEYQDTNLAQYAIVRGLSINFPNLAVTGDPDQSIYGWRGANLSNILEFEKDYPNVRVVRLEQNYRSTPRILAIADALIANNRRRLKKNLFTEISDGPPVRLIAYPTQKEEAEQIAEHIAAEVACGNRRQRDFAIFYRINALSRPIEQELRQRGLAYQIVHGVEFYQRKEIKDAVAYLQLINNPRDDVAFLRIVNVPARKIGKVTLGRLSDYARFQDISLLQAARQSGMIDSISKSTAVHIARFVSLMDKLGEQTLASVEQLLGSVLTESGYHALLKNSESPEDLERLANLEELLTDAHEFDVQNPEPGQLETFLEERALVNETDDWEDSTDAVTLMTLHAAKGLEFPVVFIVAVEQGLLPHDRSMQDRDQLEEERRLLFVGITRAEQELQLSRTEYRSFRGKTNRAVCSEFLLELPRGDMEVIESSHSMPLPEFDEFYQGEPDDGEFEIDLSADASLQDLPALARASELLANSAGPGEAMVRAAAERIDPGTFRVGMAVNHPDYGLGKIVALSGSGKQRTASINFATGAGRRTIVLWHSDLRPLT